MPYIFKLGRFWVLLAFIIVAVFFSLNNQNQISVDLSPMLKSEITTNAYRVYFTSFLIGATVTILFFGYENIRKSIMIRGLRKEIRELEAQVPQQEMMPLSNMSRLSENEIVPSES
jgi:uncharacterized membrane protein YciS (DUF1049 family)